MSWFDSELNAQADWEAGRIASTQFHSGDPGVLGTANEISGASGAPTFNAAGAVGPLGASDQPATVGVAWADLSVSIPADTYVRWYTHRDSGGAVLGAFSVPEEYFASAGTYSPNLGVGQV